MDFYIDCISKIGIFIKWKFDTENMPRPPKHRRIRCNGELYGFVPICPPTREPVELGLDHIEALRLYDVEGLDQEQAAIQMGVSRATFGRIIREAHKLLAEAVLDSRALVVKSPKAVEVRCEGMRKRRRRGFYG